MCYPLRQSLRSLDDFTVKRSYMNALLGSKNWLLIINQSSLPLEPVAPTDNNGFWVSFSCSYFKLISSIPRLVYFFLAQNPFPFLMFVECF